MELVIAFELAEMSEFKFLRVLSIKCLSLTHNGDVLPVSLTACNAQT
jgi:hypothetical protein